MVMEIIISVILLIVGIAVLMIIHICVVGRAFRSNPRRDEETGRSDRIPGLKPDDLESLPSMDYGGPGIGSSLECAVCLESFNAGEKCRVLPTCGHVYHVGCIDSWLLKTGACPICRTSAKSDELEVSRGSASGESGLEMV